MSSPHNPWKTINSHIIHQDKWTTLYVDDVINPIGDPTTYTYTKSPPYVMIVTLDGHNQFVFVRQYRYPLQQEMIELPGGGIDDAESPLQAAKRELVEETGLSAKTWTQLGTYDSNSHATVFLAEDLSDTGQHKMHEDGIAEVVRLSWVDIDHKLANGQFTDSKTLASLFLYGRYTLTSTT
jgi:ADP-ribose pyrophosphatase